MYNFLNTQGKTLVVLMRAGNICWMSTMWQVLLSVFYDITYNILNLHNSHTLEVLYLLAPFYSWGNKTQNGQNTAAETHSVYEGARIWTYIDSGIYRPKHHTALLLRGAKEKISVHQDWYPHLQTFTSINKLGACGKSGSMGLSQDGKEQWFGSLSI